MSEAGVFSASVRDRHGRYEESGDGVVDEGDAVYDFVLSVEYGGGRNGARKVVVLKREVAEVGQLGERGRNVTRQGV